MYNIIHIVETMSAIETIRLFSRRCVGWADYGVRCFIRLARGGWRLEWRQEFEGVVEAGADSGADGDIYFQGRAEGLG